MSTTNSRAGAGKVCRRSAKALRSRGPTGTVPAARSSTGTGSSCSASGLPPPAFTARATSGPSRPGWAAPTSWAAWSSARGLTASASTPSHDPPAGASWPATRTTTGSVPTRRATNPSTNSVSASSRCASSTTIRSGRSTASADNRDSTATAVSDRPAAPASPASTPRNADAWDTGRAAIRCSTGRSNVSRPAKGVPDSHRAGCTASGAKSGDAAVTWSRSAVLPMPGSPQSTRAPPVPRRARSSTSVTAAISACRPTSGAGAPVALIASPQP